GRITGSSPPAPLLDGRTVEISRAGRTAQALASAEIPSRATTAGAAPRLLAGSWTDSDRDRRWVSPSADELLHEIDHFHYPRGSALGDSTWAEWHYFNLRLDPERWLYLTYMVAGEVGVPGRWGGRLLLTVRDPERGHVNYSRDIDAREVVIDTARADLRLDDAAYVRVANGEYHVVARVGGADMDLRIRPAPNRFFPTASLGGPDVVSGYVVPAIAATATGRVCLPPSGRCEEVDGAAA